ncbi:MAG: periplasmic heavy metal sensor [Verrucomicrobiales bacterium]|nr:periplasmic heavy metal sensor [Verrucomicrobiales bacterium]
MKTHPHLVSIVALLALALCSRATEPAGDLKSALPAPEFYVKHRQALNLTAEQGSGLQAVLDTQKREFRPAEAEVTARSRELSAAVEDTSLPAAEVTRKLQALLQAENRAKEIRFDASLAARRLLTPEQWAKANSLAASASARSAAPAAAGVPEATREDLRKKLEQVRALALEVFPDGPSAEYRNAFQRLQAAVRAGQTEEARKLFDEVIADLEKRRKR